MRPAGRWGGGEKGIVAKNELFLYDIPGQVYKLLKETSYKKKKKKKIGKEATACDK